MKKLLKWIKKHKIFTALLVLLVAGGIVFLALPKATVTYSEERVARRDIVTYNSFVGNIQPSSEIDLIAKASDVIEKVYVKEGDAVKEGDLLAELDTDTLEYNIEKAEKNLEISRYKYDYELKNATSAQQRLLLMNTTGESLKISEMELDRLKDTRKDYKIYATADGVITYLNLTEGATVTAGMSVARISDLSNLEISIRIDEYSVLNAKEGLPVTIYVDSTGKTYSGSLAKIAKVATVQGGVSYFTATVAFVADDDAHSGISAEVRLIKANRISVIAVLSEAIKYNDDNTAYLYLKGADGSPVKTAVTLGASDGKYVEILSGVSVGDIVLYTPTITNPMELMMQRSRS